MPITFKKEDLYIRAITNQIKIGKMMNLNFQLNDGNITEEEYYREIEENDKEYVIHVETLEDQETFDLICEIVKDLDLEISYSLSDVEELFSYKLDKFVKR